MRSIFGMHQITITPTALARMSKDGRDKCANPKCKRQFKVGEKVLTNKRGKSKKKWRCITCVVYDPKPIILHSDFRGMKVFRVSRC